VGGKDQLLHKVTLGYGSSFSIKLDESFPRIGLAGDVTVGHAGQSFSRYVGQGNVALHFQETPVL
jgi:hypothetical protein